MILIVAFGVTPGVDLALFPFVVLALLGVTIAVSMIVASLYLRFRDLAMIWMVLSTVLFYATPVLYPIEAVPSTYRDLILLNPLTPMFELTRRWMIDPGPPGAVNAAGELEPTCSPPRSPSSSGSASSGPGTSIERRADHRGALSGWNDFDLRPPQAAAAAASSLSP